MTALLELGYKNELNVQISCGYRSPEEQDALYSIGRTRPGKVVTNAKAGQSKHQKRIAVDLFFLDSEGKADFGTSLYKKLWTLAVRNGLDKQGLVWSGNWKTFKEMAHFENGSEDI
jgi:peptidoglycan L-alanyl-D-glutamate endopeptidase CwlK